MELLLHPAQDQIITFLIVAISHCVLVIFLLDYKINFLKMEDRGFLSFCVLSTILIISATFVLLFYLKLVEYLYQVAPWIFVAGAGIVLILLISYILYILLFKARVSFKFSVDKRD